MCDFIALALALALPIPPGCALARGVYPSHPIPPHPQSAFKSGPNCGKLAEEGDASRSEHGEGEYQRTWEARGVRDQEGGTSIRRRPGPPACRRHAPPAAAQGATRLRRFADSGDGCKPCWPPAERSHPPTSRLHGITVRGYGHCLQHTKADAPTREERDSLHAHAFRCGAIGGLRNSLVGTASFKPFDLRRT
jgi:hypothetical protein